MIINDNNYYVENKVKFGKIDFINNNYIKKAFDFAYDMSFGGKGKHRCNRSGGQIKRKNGEIFINTFQGKLAELAFYEFFSNKGFEISFPDFETYDLGIWDSADFEVTKNDKSYLFSIKSTKFYGNLMLLETKDYDNNGEYIPNRNKCNAKYDYFSLVRISPDSESLMKSNKLLYLNECDKTKLQDIILDKDWKYDIPGYISNNDLVEIINKEQIIPQGALLNNSTNMDAENYYIETGCMRQFKI